MCEEPRVRLACEVLPMLHLDSANAEAAHALAVELACRSPLSVPDQPQPLPQTEAVQQVQHHTSSRAHQPPYIFAQWRKVDRAQRGERRVCAVNALPKSAQLREREHAAFYEMVEPGRGCLRPQLRDHCRRAIDAKDGDAALSQHERVGARTAAEVEHPLARRER